MTDLLFHAQAVKKQADRMTYFANIFPRYAWITSVVVNKIALASQAITKIANEAGEDV